MTMLSRRLHVIEMAPAGLLLVAKLFSNFTVYLFLLSVLLGAAGRPGQAPPGAREQAGTSGPASRARGPATGAASPSPGADGC